MSNRFQEPFVQSHTDGFTTTEDASNFLKRVYTVMAFGLAITGMTGWYVGNKVATGEWAWLLNYSIFLAFAPLILVLVLSARVHKMSFTAVNIMFASYALLNGIALSPILLIYTGASLGKTFLITAGTFGAMSFIGWTTKTDLTGLGNILRMALIGIIIALVVNIFLKSELMDYIVSFIGVGVFCGLTAYDTQKLLAVGAQGNLEDEGMRKFVVMGALTLYLDFLNLFLFLLRFFGSRD